MPRASKLFVPSGFPTITLYGPILSPLRATCSTNLNLLDVSTRKIFMKSTDRELLTMQFPPVFCYFLPLLPKSLLQYPVIKHPEQVFLP